MAEIPSLRMYKNSWFAKFARKERISDSALCDAIDRATRGLIDADLGGGLIKQRVAREGAGKSGGYRTLIFFRAGERSIFVFGFAKSDKANLDADELTEFKKAAKELLQFSQKQMDALVEIGRLMEVKRGEEDL
ncbi:type II toxin-antitoxin system RelE/ParE family toxin [Novosphingobium sp. Fuku2-ISO-50]|uniref:type II toxin-antitoxin system RelE/ParE family toxin n=1 Tax=Novosphingobium sp. Fuku2-ISO-50 TaxID=1739114 RepID=UPI00076D6666|nr:addiction module toxin RelE [Novosphingobium sp. Fuku2-ISO-50]